MKAGHSQIEYLRVEADIGGGFKNIEELCRIHETQENQ